MATNMGKMDAFRNAIRKAFPELTLNIGSPDWDVIPKGKALDPYKAQIALYVAQSGVYTEFEAIAHIGYIDTFRASRGTGQRGSSNTNKLMAELAALKAKLAED